MRRNEYQLPWPADAFTCEQLPDVDDDESPCLDFDRGNFFIPESLNNECPQYYKEPDPDYFDYEYNDDNDTYYYSSEEVDDYYTKFYSNFTTSLPSPPPVTTPPVPTTTTTSTTSTTTTTTPTTYTTPSTTTTTSTTSSTTSTTTRATISSTSPRNNHVSSSGDSERGTLPETDYEYETEDSKTEEESPTLIEGDNYDDYDYDYDEGSGWKEEEDYDYEGSGASPEEDLYFEGDTDIGSGSSHHGVRDHHDTTESTEEPVTRPRVTPPVPSTPAPAVTPPSRDTTSTRPVTPPVRSTSSSDDDETHADPEDHDDRVYGRSTETTPTSSWGFSMTTPAVAVDSYWPTTGTPYGKEHSWSNPGVSHRPYTPPVVHTSTSVYPDHRHRPYAPDRDIEPRQPYAPGQDVDHRPSYSPEHETHHRPHPSPFASDQNTYHPTRPSPHVPGEAVTHWPSRTSPSPEPAFIPPVVHFAPPVTQVPKNPHTTSSSSVRETADGLFKNAEYISINTTYRGNKNTNQRVLSWNDRHGFAYTINYNFRFLEVMYFSRLSKTFTSNERPLKSLRHSLGDN